jgi:hypothetical protein
VKKQNWCRQELVKCMWFLCGICSIRNEQEYLREKKSATVLECWLARNSWCLLSLFQGGIRDPHFDPTHETSGSCDSAEAAKNSEEIAKSVWQGPERSSRKIKGCPQSCKSVICPWFSFCDFLEYECRSMLRMLVADFPNQSYGGSNVWSLRFLAWLHKHSY